MTYQDLGGVIEVNCDLIRPVQVKIDSMNLNNINIIVGQNGSGKSFLNKIIYFASFFAYTRIGKSFPILSGETDKEKIQFLFDNVFTAPEEMTGNFSVKFERGQFECCIINGVLSTGSFTCEPEVIAASFPKYMSTTTRLFSGMEGILSLANALPDNDILKYYKLYDLLHCMNLKLFATHTQKVPDELSLMLKAQYDVDIKSLEYDEQTEKFIWVDSFGGKRPASNIGSGHQSLVNMMLSSVI